jgi:hypothetical protein
MQSFSSSHRPARRFVGLLVLLLLGTLLVLPAQAAPAVPLVVGDSVNWQQPPAPITNVSRANFPRAAIDAGNFTHVVFISEVDLRWELRYINNRSGAFNSPGLLLETLDSNPSIPSAILLIGPNDVLHLAYVLTKTDDELYYRQSTDHGATWSPRQAISAVDSIKSSEPNMAIGSDGTAHFVWLSNECGKPNVYYRSRTAAGALSGISLVRGNCKFQNRPSVTIAEGKPHVIYSEDSAEVHYARLEGGQWLDLNLSGTSSPSLNPSIASDGGKNLFAAWDENSGNHEIWFKASFDGGVNWSAPNPLTNNPGISTYPFVGWSSSTQLAYIVWHDQGSGTIEDIWEREFDPVSKVTSAAFQVSNNAGVSKNPMIAFGPNRADLVWHDTTTGSYQVFDLGGTLKSVTTCTGSIALETSPTKNNPISGTITPSGDCAPDQMQISVDTPIESTTSPAPISYDSTPSIQLPDGGCSHTVYVRLFANGVAGSVFTSAPIVVDRSVDADVLIANPNMAGLPPIYNGVAPADAYEDGAKDGDSRYTRDQFFFLGIDRGGDCSELASFSVPPLIASGSIPANGYAKSLGLPGSTFPGPRPVTVAITDTLGNRRDYTTNLVYDPADTDPSPAVTNTLGLPVLDTSKQPTLAGPSLPTDYVVVKLLFTNIQVQDNLYGDGSGAGTADFWGVWVANSPTNVGGDSATLQWFPVQVENPGPTFAIDWNLFTGLLPAEQHAGPYFVYVRMLDGAGNPSREVLETQITLAPNYDVARSYLPAVVR